MLYAPDDTEDSVLSRGHGWDAQRDIRGNPPMAGRRGGPPVRQVQTEPIRVTVTVRRDPERAFYLFTSQMGAWWPVESYSRAVSEFEHENVEVSELEFQARMGGSILEHMSDGRILAWAKVVAWQPSHRVLLDWRPHSVPEPPTEVEVTFTARGGLTSVDLEHRGWERLSETFREGLHEIYVRGWPTTLGCFAAAANRDIE
jgi:uncharacterized protein YndB with AHSA1/START domain